MLCCEERLAPSLSGHVALTPPARSTFGFVWNSGAFEIDEHRRRSCAVPAEYEWESTRRVLAARFSTEPDHFRVSSLCGDRGVPVSSSASQLRETVRSGLVRVLTVDIGEKSFRNDVNLRVHVRTTAWTVQRSRVDSPTRICGSRRYAANCRRK